MVLNVLRLERTAVHGPVFHPCRLEKSFRGSNTSTPRHTDRRPWQDVDLQYVVDALDVLDGRVQVTGLYHTGQRIAQATVHTGTHSRTNTELG